MTDISINEISNGYTVYFIAETRYYKTKEEVLERINEILSRNTGKGVN